MMRPFRLLSIQLAAASLAILCASTPAWAQESRTPKKQAEKGKSGGDEKKQEKGREDTTKLGTIAGKVVTRPKKYGKDVLVYLKEVKGTFPPPKKKPELDQKNLVFSPHILPVVVGSTVAFRNSDDVLHNVFSPDNEKYNLGTWAKGKTKDYTFKKRGVYTQLCNVHPEMQAYILVLQNPFWSHVSKDSAFKLDRVPPGKYTVVCWSERLKSGEQEVVVKAGETTTVDFSLRKRK